MASKCLLLCGEFDNILQMYLTLNWQLNIQTQLGN